MREILFRGKRTDNGEWVYGFYVRLGDNLHYILTGKLDITKIIPQFVHYEVIPETVGQFTGLYDSTKWEELSIDEQALFLYPENGDKRSKEDWKGRRIFEGNIVRQDYSTTTNASYDPDTLGFIDGESIEGHHIGIVKITAHNGVCMRNPISYDDVYGGEQKVNRYVNVCGRRCKVIGNTHDNPELLEVEK